jgi:hypothetical protein
MPLYIKSHESPNDKPKRNKKGKLKSARLRQLKKSRNKLREKLKKKTAHEKTN